MDGTPLPPGIIVRTIGGDDLPALERFYGSLSVDSLDARFHGAMRGIGDRAARTFCSPDHVHREGLVAVERRAGRDTIVGHICLEPMAPDEVEMAVVVADAWQQRGIGRALLAAAIGWAAAHGFARVNGSIRWSNPAIMSLVRSVGRPVRIVTHADGDTEAVIDVGHEGTAAA